MLSSANSRIDTIISIIEDRLGYRTDEEAVRIATEDNMPVQRLLNALPDSNLLKIFYLNRSLPNNFNYNMLSPPKKLLYVYLQNCHASDRWFSDNTINISALFQGNFTPAQFRHAVLIEPDLRQKLIKVGNLAEQGYLPAKDWMGRYYLTQIQNNLDDENKVFISDETIINWLVSILCDAFTQGHSKTIYAVEKFISNFLEQSLDLNNPACTPERKAKCRYMGKIAGMLAKQLSLNLQAPEKGNQVAKLIEACLTHPLSVPPHQVEPLKRKRRYFCGRIFNADPFHKKNHKMLQLNRFTELLLQEEPSLIIDLKKNNPIAAVQIHLPPKKPSIIEKIKQAGLNFLAGELVIVCVVIIISTIFIGCILASTSVFSPALLILSASGITLGAKIVTTLNVAIYALAGVVLGAGVTLLSGIKTWIADQYRTLKSPSPKSVPQIQVKENIIKDFFALSVDPQETSSIGKKSSYNPLFSEKKATMSVYVPGSHDRIDTVKNSDFLFSYTTQP